MTRHQAQADLTIEQRWGRTDEERSADALEEIARQLKALNGWIRTLVINDR